MSSTELESRRPDSPESSEPSSKRAKVATPFDDLEISDDSILDSVTDRSECPRCKKSVKYFCYRCFDVVGMERSQIPKVKLPVRLNVIKHERELDGKSTAVHAKVIAKDDVDFYTWGEIPDFEQPERSLLLFPGPDAKQLKDIPRDSYDRITVIDGTWRQASRIVRETPVLHKMQKVTIAPRKTHFWRFQQLSENHLATIEAIYYVYREFGEMVEGNYDDGRYDNLLFYYRYFYKMIQHVYRNNDKSFTHRHRKNYIQYDGDRSQQQKKDEDPKEQKEQEKEQENQDQKAKASE